MNPLGPRLLAFPFSVLGRREAFAHVVEWRSPSFQSGAGLLTLVALVGVVVVVARTRPPWCDLLPLAAFTFAALAAQRNLPMLAVVAAPVLSRALRRPPGVGADDPRRPVLHLGFGAVLAALGLLFAIVVAGQPALDLGGYPVEAARLVPPGAKVATTDIGAGYLVLRRGGAAHVLIDDRVDLYPVHVTLDYVRLLDGRPGALDVLERYDADVVVWEADRPLSAQLAASERWRRIGTRDGWAVWVRAGG